MSIRVNGSSMRPSLKNGMIVHVIAKDSYSIGDVVLFFSDVGLVVHRIISKYTANSGGLFYITKGDNATYSDGKIFCKRIIGCVVGVAKVPKIVISLQNKCTLTYQELSEKRWMKYVYVPKCYIIHFFVKAILSVTSRFLILEVEA